MTASQLKILNIKNLNNVKFCGSNNIYWQKYPYKVKLVDNNILYDIGRFSEIATFLNNINTFGNGTAKIRNSYTRNIYFTDLKDIEEFTHYFSDQIDYVAGPLTKNHIDCLITKMMNSSREHRYEVRKQKFFKEYDLRLMFIPSWSLNSLSSWSDRHQQRLNAFSDACDYVDNCRTLHRNLYVCTEDLDEIRLFTKLKYPNVKIFCTEALVEPLL